MVECNPARSATLATLVADGCVVINKETIGQIGGLPPGTMVVIEDIDSFTEKEFSRLMTAIAGSRDRACTKE